MLGSSTHRITRIHYTYGCLMLTLAYCCQLHLENSWVTLNLSILHLNQSLCWLSLPSESQRLTSRMAVQPSVQPHPQLVAPNFPNHWVLLHLQVFSLKCSLLMLGLLTESPDLTRLIGAPTKVHLMILSCSYTLTELHNTYGNATLSADYVGYLYFQNHWVTPYKWMSNPKDTICWLALPRE